MVDVADRRRAPRWRLRKQVLCYVDGQRMDAFCENISSSGLLLMTAHLNSLPLGSRLGLVFEPTRQGRNQHPAVFLFGLVVRHQHGSSSGIGLRWTKAVAGGPASLLEAFLPTTLRLDGVEVVQTGVSPSLTSTYGFDELYGIPMPLHVRADGNLGPPEPRVSGGLARAADPQTPPERVINPPRVGPVGSAPGALTQMVNDNNSVGLRLSARIQAGGQDRSAVITSLSLRSMRLECESLLTQVGGSAEVSFKLSERHTKVQLSCRCRVKKVSAPTEKTTHLSLLIEETHEGEHQGLLTRYVKWLHFHALQER